MQNIKSNRSRQASDQIVDVFHKFISNEFAKAVPFQGPSQAI
jgi:hypothetical protein